MPTTPPARVPVAQPDLMSPEQGSPGRLSYRGPQGGQLPLGPGEGRDTPTLVLCLGLTGSRGSQRRLEGLEVPAPLLGSPRQPGLDTPQAPQGPFAYPVPEPGGPIPRGTAERGQGWPGCQLGPRRFWGVRWVVGLPYRAGLAGRGRPCVGCGCTPCSSPLSRLLQPP